jgi:hypothetical protein
VNKKDLSNASLAAVNKFFSQPESEYADDTKDTNNEYVTKHDNINKYTKHTYVTNKSKYYDERGKREIRHALLLDKQLKDDLIQLCNAKGNRSMNDYIVSLLIEHTNLPENQSLIEKYNKLKSK